MDIRPAVVSGTDSAIKTINETRTSINGKTYPMNTAGYPKFLLITTVTVSPSDTSYFPRISMIFSFLSAIEHAAFEWHEAHPDKLVIRTFIICSSLLMTVPSCSIYVSIDTNVCSINRIN